MRELLTIFAVVILSTPLVAAEPKFIAIIIDDVGNSLDRGERAIALPAPITISVLPHSRYGPRLAQRASAAGKEVMVHMPMANISGKPIGPMGLKSAMSHEDFTILINRALAEIPGARGINNHMGSYLTQQAKEMEWLMDVVKRRNLFFIDSRTTPRSIASRVAERMSVFSSIRDVFLDNNQTFFEIDQEFRRLVHTAEVRGTAIAIGHPHAITLDYLEMVIPQLDDKGIRVIPASNLIAIQKMTKYQFARRQTNTNAGSTFPGAE
ncbi:MAG: divergent polysaccharide deacetylase family protein [Pseudomonadales bacterium]